MSTKILVVDDSSTARLLLKMCLKKLGDFEIHESGDPNAAITIAKEQSPDLCILDYNMPDIVGTDLAVKIKEVCPNSKFIMMTANMQQAVVDEAKSVGFSAFIEKPVNAEKVCIAIERVL
ncbi:MAG: response regulator [Francisellaceae bacterium]|jgi:two-component system, chemotaxis family, chemotaxis protein CheY|nr:response regulator [Francisellaceae bacterium]MBT6207683.1 response regulator [Francisellaceae bacterium]MBT6539448.1 response regulator [Francisellaceae bacterium]